MRTLLSLPALMLGGALALPAAAEIYECRGRDGKTIFTTRAEACPGAAPRALKGEVQRFDEAERRTPPAAPRESSAPTQVEEADAERWKARRREAESEKRELESQAEAYREIVTWCNRGASMYARDRNGVPTPEYDCDEARTEHERMAKRLAELTAYLESGLEEECRRAGCLPGWIR